jgi:hypothetical protein
MKDTVRRGNKRYIWAPGSQLNGLACKVLFRLPSGNITVELIDGGDLYSPGATVIVGAYELCSKKEFKKRLLANDSR